MTHSNLVAQGQTCLRAPVSDAPRPLLHGYNWASTPSRLPYPQPAIEELNSAQASLRDRACRPSGHISNAGPLSIGDTRQPAEPVPLAARPIRPRAGDQREQPTPGGLDSGARHRAKRRCKYCADPSCKGGLPYQLCQNPDNHRRQAEDNEARKRTRMSRHDAT